MAMEISKMFQNLSAVAAVPVAAFPAALATELELLPRPNNLTDKIASKTVSAAITTVVTFADRRIPT